MKSLIMRKYLQKHIRLVEFVVIDFIVRMLIHHFLLRGGIGGIMLLLKLIGPIVMMRLLILLNNAVTVLYRLDLIQMKMRKTHIMRCARMVLLTAYGIHHIDHGVQVKLVQRAGEWVYFSETVSQIHM